MIRDAAFALSTEQTLVAAPVFTGTSINGYLSDNYYDMHNLGVSGGRIQYVELEFTEACDVNLTLALNIWPDGGVALRPAENLIQFGGNRYLSQMSLLVADGTMYKGARHYLPIDVASIDFLPQNLSWRWLDVIYLGGGATTGAVSARLVDAITHKPRVFEAQNDT